MIHHLLVPPNFTWEPANQTVMEGTKTAFHCNASGNPTPKISWMKDGNALAEGNSLSLETNRNNSGNYWCLAKNGVGETINTTAYLDVQCKFDKETDEVMRCVKSFKIIVSKPVVDPGGSSGRGGVRKHFPPPPLLDLRVFLLVERLTLKLLQRQFYILLLSMKYLNLLVFE